MSKLYRIFTEDKNRSQIKEIVSIYFSGFSIIPVNGYYEGKKEKSICIEIVSYEPYGVAHSIEDICKRIKNGNKQDCVLLEVLNVETKFI